LKYDSFLRRTALGISTQPSALAVYGYDNASRLGSVANGANSAAYTYVANSPLVGQIEFVNNGALRVRTTKNYDNLNRLTSISTANAQAIVLDLHGYSYNNANQRTGMTNSDSSFWVYQYDSLGQVTNGSKCWSDGTPVAGEQFGYIFDSIGNRQSTTAGGDQSGLNLRSASYSANNLNQYTSRTVPNAPWTCSVPRPIRLPSRLTAKAPTGKTITIARSSVSITVRARCSSRSPTSRF
jgi:YD repeat-containing protein